MGFALTQAERWLAKRKGDIRKADQSFIAESHKVRAEIDV